MQSPATILSIDNLTVDFDTPDGNVNAVDGLSAFIKQGECLGIVGESGSGKSQTVLAAMGLLANNANVSGSVLYRGKELLKQNQSTLNRIRGRYLSMIFQDPLTSLTPHLKIGDQLLEVLKHHQQYGERTYKEHCIYWLEKVRIPEPAYRLEQYPHELSGGMRQRVMIAMAMLCQPELLIADEPTTALDVTIQADILDLMNELRAEHNTAIVLITHDMGVVARMCDRVQVMRYGKCVETGSCDQIFYNPRHPYTKMLLDAVPKIPTITKMAGYETDRPDTVSHLSKVDIGLSVSNLKVEFTISRGWFKPKTQLKAVEGIAFSLGVGETLGIVGESGSGKSTLARAILQLLPSQDGTVSWHGRELNTFSKRELIQLRKDIQIVFQDPLASLNPSMTIGESIAEPLTVFAEHLNKMERQQKVFSIMQRVGLGQEFFNRYPHELSGGQNQRVGIARAMIMEPKVLICDEAVSALDVSIQAQIILLLKQLQIEFGLSLIFISHDLSVVWDVSSRIMVMYLGSVVELASREDLFSHPQHPYTRQLISAVPTADPRFEKGRDRLKLKGELASPMDPKGRLRFLASRSHQLPDDYVPALEERFPNHFVAEHDPLEELLHHE